MKRFFALATLMICMFTLTTAFASSKDSVAEQRRQIEMLHDQTLEKLYEKYPAGTSIDFKVSSNLKMFFDKIQMAYESK